MTKLTVVDSLCGMGKTSYAIQMMNETAENGFGIQTESTEKFMFVTPFKKEIERIIQSTTFNIYTPSDQTTTKLQDAKKLIKDGKSIAMTHELFSRFDEDTLLDIETEGYILIMDEVANVVEQVDISEDDLRLLMSNNTISIQEDGRVLWNDTEYRAIEDNSFTHIKVLAETENLYIDKTNSDKVKALFWTMNVKAFTSFKAVYILTYLFDGQLQKYYYKFHNVDYTKVSVKKNRNGKYELVEYNKQLEPRAMIKELLNIYENIIPEGKGRRSELNTNYNHDRKKNPNFLLSSTWFKNAKPEEINQLRKNLNTYFTTQAKVTKDESFWTTKKDMGLRLNSPKNKFDKKRMNPKKDEVYKDNFLSFNVRATNEYADRKATAFVYNRFMNPMEKGFFTNRGIEVDEDLLALSDLIQFLFRGCIRNNEEMSCYIPSPRMRGLLYDWLEFKEGNKKRPCKNGLLYLKSNTVKLQHLHVI